MPDLRLEPATFVLQVRLSNHQATTDPYSTHYELL